MDIITVFFLYLVILIALTIHEYSHAWMANFLGDPTARYAGRLTLNPLVHIDVLWTLILPVLSLLMGAGFIGAAKPVPFNPYNLRNQKYGPALIGAAGPLSNVLIAIIIGLIVRFLVNVNGQFVETLKLMAYINISLAIFNLIPIPPLDGSKILQFIVPERYHNILVAPPIQLMIVGIAIVFYIAPIILPPIINVVYNLLVLGAF